MPANRPPVRGVIKPPPAYPPGRSAVEANVADVLQPVLGRLIADVAHDGARMLVDPTPEVVHTMRGDLRRLSAALSLLSFDLEATDIRWLRRQLRWLVRRLGETRDLDVFMAAHAVTDGCPEEDACRARLAAVRRAQEALRSARATTLINGLWSWTSEGPAFRRMVRSPMPFRVEADNALGRLDGELRRAGDPIAELDANARHRLRRRVKELRYAADIVARIFPNVGAGAYLAALAALHRVLGDLNDAEVGRRLAQEFAGKAATHGRASRHSMKKREKDLLLAWARFLAIAPYRPFEGLGRVRAKAARARASGDLDCRQQSPPPRV